MCGEAWNASKGKEGSERKRDKVHLRGIYGGSSQEQDGEGHGSLGEIRMCDGEKTCAEITSACEKQRAVRKR